MMIPFKGKSPKTIYHTINKPPKWGFEVWARAHEYGYVSNFEMYSGASISVNPSYVGPVRDVVRFCHYITGVNHKLFIDNFFYLNSTSTYPATETELV